MHVEKTMRMRTVIVLLSCCLWEFIPWYLVVEFSMCFLTSVFGEEQQSPAALVSLASSEALSGNEGCRCGVAHWISTSPSDHLLVAMPTASCQTSSSAWGLPGHSVCDTADFLRCCSQKEGGGRRTDPSLRLSLCRVLDLITWVHFLTGNGGFLV